MAGATKDIFELKCMLKNISIRLCCRIESGVKQLLALITSDGDVVLHYTYGELPPIIKRIPWLTDINKTIEAITFDPTATWLLVVASDGCLYIIPALSLVDKRQKIDCKWSLNDVTQFVVTTKQHNNSLVPDAKPTSIVWWQTFDSNQNALVGYENGAIALISLTDGRCLASCGIAEPVTQLCLCQDNALESVSLLINGESGQQWRLMLEQHSVGYLWPADSIQQQSITDTTTRSRLYNFKQMMGVGDKFVSLKQRLTEVGTTSNTRGLNRRKDVGTTSSNDTMTHYGDGGPELLPCLCDTCFLPQYARNRYLFSALYKPTSLLTVHAVDVESAPVYVHKLISNTDHLLLTDKLIYTVNNERNIISVISAQLSECRIEGNSEFNIDSLVAQFKFEQNEKILHIYKLSDLSAVRIRKSKDGELLKKTEKSKCSYNNSDLPKSTINDVNIRKPRTDTIVIITNTSVYKLAISCSPVNKFVQFVVEQNDLIMAERIALIFGLNLQQLLEYCGDLMIARGSHHTGIILYKQAKVHLLKRVLKLAVATDCRTLLKFIHLCLSSSKIDMSMATKIHIGNLAVMAYTELLLRFGGRLRIANTKDFMNFLRYEEYFDQVLAVNVACQAGHWNIVNLLARTRGLQPEVVAALGQILSQRPPQSQAANHYDFLLTLSEPSLTQSLLLLSSSLKNMSRQIFHYIRTNVDTFPVDILQRFAIQLDPSQPCVRSLVSRSKFVSSSLSSSSSNDDDTIIGSMTTSDLSNQQQQQAVHVIVKELIETYLFVLINLVSINNNNKQLKYDLKLIEKIDGPDEIIIVDNNDDDKLKTQFPNFNPLSCGYEHATVVRNGSLYAMGVSSAGCLGLGPLLTQSSPAKLVQTFEQLRVQVLSTSCGRKHSLALTDYGVYAWGSNFYGQLGVGRIVQETPYPQLITTLCDYRIVQIACGQYHSLALTAGGRVFSWGWGIHGQLGHNDGICINQYYPKMIIESSLPLTIVQITAGHAHSLMLTSDGELYGCGSNIFGQLEKKFDQSEMETEATTTINDGIGCNNNNNNNNKAMKPVRVLVMPDYYMPIEKIATAYFHNVAVRQDQEIYTWGASPQELRVLQSTRAAQKQQQLQNNTTSKKQSNNNDLSWKNSVRIYSASKPNNKIEQISIGYRHTAILLRNGKILWGKNKDTELMPLKKLLLNNVDVINNVDYDDDNDDDTGNLLHNLQRFNYVSCGLDYTMAIDCSGKVLAWGSPSMAQIILGRPLEHANNSRQVDGKIIMLKNTKRFIKFPTNLLQSDGSTNNNNNLPIEVPGLPKMAITFSSIATRKSTFKNNYSILRIENNDVLINDNNKSFMINHQSMIPSMFKYGDKTLHYVLETYHRCYDSDTVLSRCLVKNNLQAASKIAMLDGHFSDSLGFQLECFRKYYVQLFDLNFDSIFYYCNHADNDNNKKQKDENEKIITHSLNNEKNNVLLMSSSSSSLDSIRQWGDEGGCESPCCEIVAESPNRDDENISSQYIAVKSLLKKTSANNSVKSKIETTTTLINNFDFDLLIIKDENTKNVIEITSKLIEFYIEQIYVSENHILMQNILMASIEFWLGNNLPVRILEMVLLKNMDKYFYPLAILLFCKNFNINNDGTLLVTADDEEDKNDDDDEENFKLNSVGFLKQFSTKFCLQLCSMVLDNVNKI